MKFPDLNGKLRHSLHHPTIRLHEKPPKPYKLDDIQAVRLHRWGHGLDQLVAPELKCRGKWIKFYLQDKPLISRVRPYSIHGIRLSRAGQVSRVEKDWQIWLRDWIKSNGLDLQITKQKAKTVELAPDKSKREKPEKPEQEIVVIPVVEEELEEEEEYARQSEVV